MFVDVRNFTEISERLTPTGLVQFLNRLLDALSRSHPLLDGNKRLSWTMVDLFYDLTGFRLTVDPVEGDAFVRTVGGDHLALGDIAAWLEAHSTPIT